MQIICKLYAKKNYEEYEKKYEKKCNNLQVYVLAYFAYICTPHFADGADFQTSFIQVITWMKLESKDISFPYCLLLLKIWALGHFSRIDEERTVGFISKTDGRSHDHLVLVYAVLFVSAEEAPQYSNNACVDARAVSS